MPRRRFFKCTRILALPMFLAAGAHADQSNTNLGSQAAPFLTWPVDARNASLAQAGVASVSDVNAPVLNPAGLASVKGEQVSLNEDILFQGTDLANAAAAVSLFDRAALGLSVTYVNIGTIDETTYNPSTQQVVSAGSFNPYYDTIGLTYAQQLGLGLSLGASLKVVGEDIAGSTADTVAVDLGAQYASPLPGLNLGLSVQNLGSPLAGSALPMLARGGISYKMPFLSLRNSLLLSLDSQVPTAAFGQTTFSGGAELRYQRFLSLRVGYQTGDYSGVSGLTGVTAGAGFGVNWWQVDYAWVPEGDLGYADQFSFSAKF
jgi:hypothetical protein